MIYNETQIYILTKSAKFLKEIAYESTNDISYLKRAKNMYQNVIKNEDLKTIINNNKKSA